jgi:hypothetical protein
MMQPDEVRQVLADADCLYTQAQVEQQLDRMAAEITANHENSNPIFLCVMTGAVVPAGHLLTRLNFPLELDYIHATRYAGATTGGELAWETEPTISFHWLTIVANKVPMKYLLRCWWKSCMIGSMVFKPIILVCKLRIDMSLDTAWITMVICATWQAFML